MKNNKPSRPGSIRGELDVRRLIFTIVYAAGIAVTGWMLTWVEGMTKRGFTMTFFLIFIVLFVRCIKRLLTVELQDAIDEWIENAARWLFRPLAIVFGKVAKWLGIGRWRGWCEDEKTFLWKDRTQGNRRRRRIKNDQKWADQTDNRHRVRYLFIEYMVKRIRTGFLYRRQMTPDEMAEELALEDEEQLLFDTYNIARYSINEEIPDEVVNILTKVTAKR